jgi:two-component system, chemotaxis family, chemotaxis protein CheY
MAPSIIITDDSRIARSMIKKLIPQETYEIREAVSGRECLDLYRASRADLVLLDLTMPEMDGFETLEKLREMDPGAQVVVITADVQTGAEQRALELGALTVLHKPPKPDQLANVLKRTLS